MFFPVYGENRLIQNQTLSSYENFFSDGILTAENVSIVSGAIVKLVSTEKISLTPPFYASEGAELKASISSSAVEIHSATPSADSIITNTRKPAFSASFSSMGGNILPEKMILSLNGTYVLNDATYTASGFSYTPSSDLANGAYQLYIKIENTQGVTAEKIIPFTINLSETGIPHIEITGYGKNLAPGGVCQAVIAFANTDLTTQSHYLELLNSDGNIIGAYEVTEASPATVNVPVCMGAVTASNYYLRFSIIDKSTQSLLTRIQTLRDIQVTANSAPKVSVDSLVNGHITLDAVLHVTGKASGDNPLTEVKVNDILAVSTDGFGTWSADVPLSLGMNTLTVSVKDSLNKTTSFQVNVGRLGMDVLEGANIQNPVIHLGFNFPGMSYAIVGDSENFEMSGWESIPLLPERKTWVVPGGPGEKSIFVSFRDAEDFVTEPLEINVNFLGHEDGEYVEIIEEDVSENYETLTLKLTAPGALYYKLSSYEDFNDATEWLPFEEYVSFAYPAGSGRKQIFADFKYE